MYKRILVPLDGSELAGLFFARMPLRTTIEMKMHGLTCGWLVPVFFVSIGLESNFKDLASQLVGGKPILLYVVGQSFNIFLTLLAAWLAFGGVLFGEVI